MGSRGLRLRLTLEHEKKSLEHEKMRKIKNEHGGFTAVLIFLRCVLMARLIN